MAGIAAEGAGGGIAQGEHPFGADHPQFGVAGQPAAAIQADRRIQRRHAGSHATGPDHRLAAQAFHGGGRRGVGAAALQFKAIGQHRRHPGVGAQPHIALLQGQMGLLAVERL